MTQVEPTKRSVRHERPHGGLVIPTGPADLESDGPRPWLIRDPVRTGFILILIAALAVRFAVLKDGFFLTDDFMLTTRALENPLGWSYLTRVHTGHFEPVGFAVMWALAHLAPLDWAVTVAVMTVGMALLLVMMWRLLVTLFGRRRLTLVPFAYFCFSTLTLPALTWLSAAIIWLPLMIAVAGLLRQHTLYLRTLRFRHALGAVLWLVFGMASFEKILVVLPLVIVFSFMVVPQLPVAIRPVLSVLRQTWMLWAGYALVTVAYLSIYLPAAHRSDMNSGFRSPGVGGLTDFAYKTLLQAFVPSALGGPWDWTPVSQATAIVSSPRAFEWSMWILAGALIALALVLRRRAGRALATLGVYLAFSILALGISRVPVIGAVAGLETRYIADAAVPLTVVVGFCLLPLLGEKKPWHPTTLGVPRELFPRLVAGVLTLLSLAVLTLSLHAMSGYATVHAANPYRGFVETARSSLAQLPASAQVYDHGIPVDVIGPLFLKYNEASRFLAPFATPERRHELYTLTEYSNPYLLTVSGELKKMTVEGISSPSPPAGQCGWQSSAGTVTIPLQAEVFDFGWAARIGYLASGPTTATVRFGTGGHTVTLHEGLGEVFFPIVGGGAQVTLTGLDPAVRVCVGDVQVGNPIPDPSP